MRVKAGLLVLTAALAGAAGPSAPTTGARLGLVPTPLTATPEQRQLLRYLIGCALPAGVEVSAEAQGVTYTFAGELGLAPAWLERPLSTAEQRWVSACILARTNYFGKSVRISLRALAPAPAALRSSSQEHAAFSLFEGGFFGNLFLPQPVAYACSGTRLPSETPEPILNDRVCTALSGATTPSGAPLTRCGFIYTGRCEDSASFNADGQHYQEVIFTYLQPASGS